MVDEGLDACAVGLAAQTCNAQRWIVDGGCLRRLGQRDPGLMGGLGAELMELPSGEQAAGGFRHTPANLDERLVLGHLAVWQAVEAAGDALELTGPVELEEQLRGPATRAQVGGAQQSLAPGELEDAFGLGRRHPGSLVCALLI